MSKTSAALYHIRVQGYLGSERADSFEGMTITREADGRTLIAGIVPDQAALHGLLARVRDLGLVLLAVDRIETAG
jgi:hypothetical protein